MKATLQLLKVKEQQEYQSKIEERKSLTIAQMRSPSLKESQELGTEAKTKQKLMMIL